MIKIGKKNIEHICDYCNKIHYIDSSTNSKLNKGLQKHCYCSKECKSLSQLNGYEIKCDFCNKLFYRRKYHIERQSGINQHNFCSVDCEYSFNHFDSIEERKCVFCNNIFSCSKKSQQRFCNTSCYDKWQTTRVGKLNSNYHRVEYSCDWCNKLFMARRYKIKNQANIFCSIKCRQNWFAKKYSQEESSKELWRNICLESLNKGKFSTTNSKPQQIVDKLLQENNISFEREYITKYYSIDNYLTKSNLMTEVMGDYWHCNPNKYNRNSDNLNHIHKTTIRKDKAKNTYIKRYYNIEILYLWEYDIINNPELCTKLILEYINKNGVLNNYHSFNFLLENNILKLKDDIIII